MPPRIPPALKATEKLVARRANSSLFSCPACSSRTLSSIAPKAAEEHRLPNRRNVTTSDTSNARSRIVLRKRNSRWTQQKANATTLASNTAINAPKNVPAAYRELYQSLHSLNDHASDAVDQSRFQLALRGLESAHPTIRIGILGLGREGETAARKLARVLLADPLGDKQLWEDKLVEATARKGALLLRYGSEDDISPQNPLLETMTIPSRVLEKNNLEILITSLNLDATHETELVEAILVPPLQTPIAASGRAGYVRYPVHKALLVGEGIDGCMSVGKLSPLFEREEDIADLKDLIYTTVNLPQKQQEHNNTHFVDVDDAGRALNLFRENISNSPVFSEKWQSSGMPHLSRWLAAQHRAEAPDSDAAVVQAGRALKSHIRSVLHSTSTSIAASEDTARAALAVQSIPESARTNLQSGIAEWAQLAHTDLQHSLDRALASRSWRRTSWYKLIWRVDDVGVAAEDVLRSHWLLNAESHLAFLAGRVSEAGFFSNPSVTKYRFNPPSTLPTTLHPDDLDAQYAASAPSLTNFTSNVATDAAIVSPQTDALALPSAPSLLRTETFSTATSSLSNLDPTPIPTGPWPQSITTARLSLLNTLVPSLQARAQALLFQSFGTVAGTSALGAWFYAATYGAGLYEAGAISAFGTVIALRRLQSRWEEAREVFVGEVRESGRVVLGEVEGVLRGVVRENERREVSPEDVEGWTTARDGVRACEEELKKLE